MPTPYAAYVAETISDLVNPQATGRNEVTVLGFNVKGDGGGGTFYWMTGTTFTDDNATIFTKAAAGSSPAGAWMRVIEGAYNVKWFGAAGDGVTDDRNSVNAAMQKASANNKPLYFPPGTYLIKSQIQLPSNLYMTGIYSASYFDTNLAKIKGIAVIKTDGAFSGSGEVFIGVAGVSNITIEGLTFTNDNAKLQFAVLRFNSYPGLNKKISIIKCEFVNFYTSNCIFFGQTSKTDPVHSNDEVYISRCRFVNIYNTTNPYYTSTGLSDSLKCYGINFYQTTWAATVEDCYFDSLSGDAIFSYGWNTMDDVTPYSYHANWNIVNNVFRNCWMFIETVGNGLGKYIKVIGNKGFNWRRDGGYALSVSNYGFISNSNTWEGFDRSACEFKGVECHFGTNDLVIIRPYTTGCGGTAAGTKTNNADGYEIYGYNNTVGGRVRFEYDIRTKDGDGNTVYTYTTHANTPYNLNGVMLVGKTDTPSSQPTDWDRITDYAAGIDINGLVVENFTRCAIGAEINKFRNVTIQNCKFSSRYVNAQVPVAINGYNWAIRNNIFDLTGSTGAFAIRLNTDLQGDDTNTVVSGNLIINDAFKIGDTDKLIAFNNQLKNASGVVYSLFIAPPVTASERTSLTGSEGMTVYQTDGTIGIYLYTGGAWKKVTVA